MPRLCGAAITSEVIDAEKVDDPTPGKNRVHLDFGAADVDAEVDRLAAGGATEVERHSIGDNFRWVVPTDPEGNAFCVAGAGGAPGTLDCAV